MLSLSRQHFAGCRRRLPAWGILLCFALLSGSSSLRSQPIGPDIRLLDLIRTGLLPDSTVIGDAALIDSSVIAVWGSRRIHQDGTGSPALVIGSEEITPRLLTPAQARPGSVVSVVSLGEKGIVLWNDARDDAPGVYAAFVDRNGERVREDTLLLPGTIQLQKARSYRADTRTLAMICIGTGEGPVRIGIWFDPDGSVVRGPDTIAEGRFADGAESAFPLAEGGGFYRGAGGESIVVLPNGDIYPEKIPAERFDAPFVVDGDVGIVTTLDGDRLVRYDSLHHTTPAWEVSGMAGRAIGRDSSGWYTADFTGTWYDAVDYLHPIAVRSHADTVSGVPARIAFDTLDPIILGQVSISWQFENRKESVEMRGDGLIRLSGSWTISVKPFGRDRYYRSIGHQIDCYSRPVELIPRIDSVNVSVVSTADSSIVEVRLGDPDRSLRLSFPTPPAIDSRSSNSPVLYSSANQVQAGCRAGEDRLMAVSIVDGDLSEAVPEPTVVIGQLPTPVDYRRGWNTTGIYLEPRTRTTTTGQPPVTTYSWANTWLTVRPGGWRTFHVQSENVYSSGTFWTAGGSVGAYDPGSDRLTWYMRRWTSSPAARGSGSSPWVRVDNTDRDLEDRRTVSSASTVLPKGWMVPYDSVTILHIDTAGLFRRYGPETIPASDGSVESYVSSALPLAFDALLVQRLFGPRFLVAGIDRGRGELSLIVCSMGGTIIEEWSTPAQDSAELPFVMQHPSDSTIILLTNGSSGPLLTIVGPELQTVEDEGSRALLDRPVSQSGAGARSVVGAVNGDRIWVSWTDDRTGEPQVYLNAFVSQSRSWERATTGVDGESVDTGRRFTVVGITPNPGVSPAGIRIGSDVAQTLEIDRYDAAGRHLDHSLLEVISGIHEYPLPNAYRTDGVYYIVVSTPEHRETIAHLCFPE